MRVPSLKGFQVTSEELLQCHFRGLPVRPHLLVRYRSTLERANTLLDPIVRFHWLTRHAVQRMLEHVRQTFPDTSELLAPLQRSDGGAYVVLCTTGPRVEAEMERSCQEKEVATAYILDAVGSITTATCAPRRPVAH